MNILFVCKYNRFRSKVAEVIFNHHNKGRKIKVRSRAVNPDYLPVAENVQKALKELGYKKADKTPRKLQEKDLKWADLIVVVADDADVEVKGKKILRWKISDVSQDNYEVILNRVRSIEKRVLKLLTKF